MKQDLQVRNAKHLEDKKSFDSESSTLKAQTRRAQDELSIRWAEFGKGIRNDKVCQGREFLAIQSDWY